MKFYIRTSKYGADSIKYLKAMPNFWDSRNQWTTDKNYMKLYDDLGEALIVAKSAYKAVVCFSHDGVDYVVNKSKLIVT